MPDKLCYAIFPHFCSKGALQKRKETQVYVKVMFTPYKSNERVQLPSLFPKILMELFVHETLTSAQKKKALQHASTSITKVSTRT